mgnify:CR=1 FL=1
MNKHQPYTGYIRSGLCLLIIGLLVGSIGLTPVILAAPLEAGNPFYRILVTEQSDGNGVGTYAVITGPDHPVGPNLNVLYRFPDGLLGTSYTTVRSYTSGTNYVQRNITRSNTVWLDAYGTVTPLDSSGFRTTYELPGAPVTPDALTIMSDLQVIGTTFHDSAVEVTTRIRNNGPTEVAIGVRYLWDFQIGRDDGPTLQPINPDGPVFVRETGFVQPTFSGFRIQDNDANPNPPTFSVYGTVNQSFSATPSTRAPDLLQFVSWRDIANVPFTYTVDPTRMIAIDEDPTDNQRDDSATTHYFGRDAANALIIAPGAEISVSAAILATPLVPLAIELRPAAAIGQVETAHTLTATIRDPDGQPLADQVVEFSVSGANTARGSSITSASGEATFRYTGEEFGTDSITAWVDLSSNGAPDPTEPTATARMTWEREPTAVTLAEFRATVDAGQVMLTWETATEIDHAGFYVYRAYSATGEYRQITPQLLLARGIAPGGARYQWTDTPGPGTFYYTLEDIDTQGLSTMHGPIMVQVEPEAVALRQRIYLPVIMRR